MQMARAGGMPVLKVLSMGTILMNPINGFVQY